MPDFDARAAAQRLMALMGQNEMPALANQTIGMTPDGRPMVRNVDGSHSTERQITGPWAPNGQWVNIPSMYGGFERSPEESVAIMRGSGWVDPDTGRKSDFFNSVEDAERAAQLHSYGLGHNMTPVPWMKISR